MTDGVGNQATIQTQFGVDNTPPTVSVTAPAAGSYLRSVITISASANDSTSGVASIDISAGGQSLGGCTYAAQPDGTRPLSEWPCSVSFDTGTSGKDGPFSIIALATDGAGNQSTLAEIDPIADNSVPSSFLLGPLDGIDCRGPSDRGGERHRR